MMLVLLLFLLNLILFVCELFIKWRLVFDENLDIGYFYL